MPAPKFKCPNGHTVVENAVCPHCFELTVPVEESKPVKQAPEAKKAE